MDMDDSEMKERAEFLLKLDPSLPPEDVLWTVYEKWGGFLCRECGSPTVFDGQNGAGTTSVLCNKCERNMSVWNTYELTLWKYKKMVSALAHHEYGGSVENISELLGVGKGALDEARACLSNLKYSRTGEAEVIEYDGLRIGIVTQDIIYKGREGVMLGVSGGLQMTEIGNEKTCEGLDTYFDGLEEKLDVDKLLVLMDMNTTVAKKLLELFQEKVIIVLQNHSNWGDVHVYFYRGGWRTLRLRTDAFTEPSRKLDEEDLLGVGEIELYKGLKGVSPRMSFKDVSEDTLRDRVKELITQFRNTDWDADGRVDLVMRPKCIRLNTLLRELQKRESDITEHLDDIREVLEDIANEYASKLGKSVKKKIVNAWSRLAMLEDEVNSLSEKILKEPLPSKSNEEKGSDKKDASEPQKEDNVKISTKPELLYRGPMDDPSVPEEALWILGLLEAIFDGKEITTNLCEGRFGSMGMTLRSGRSMYLERALTRVHLRNQDVGTTYRWLVNDYPIKDLGKRGERRDRKQIEVGARYRITYVDRYGVKTEREIEVIEKKKKTLDAYCHLREDTRTFRRDRIKNIVPLQQ
ncbi:hypothetical protein AKJ44_02090 [candidate division MSBL1 archaeon SCGC-AAA261F17]|uniref:Uncharacterized protein n=1 Tax=candidate division MSBL1 archaeon SCGC-AAA261F17 TaxID=1698274 RepID=A0A133V5Y1_9EURY|nr:hypothetical protein AKJ44_02090 [candidate division MSBL1 archaeon SCGC-AAA261F17]